MDIDTRMIQMMQEMMKIRGSIIERITISEMLLKLYQRSFIVLILDNQHLEKALSRH